MLGFLPLFLTWFLGITISFVISRDFKDLERTGLGFLIGIGVQTWTMFLLYLVGFRFTLISFFIQWLLLIVIAVAILARQKRLDIWKNFFKQVADLRKLFIKSDKIFIILLGGILGISLFIGLYWPVIGWDALALYDFRAKTFIATGGMEDGIARGFFFLYPLLTSLGHTWVYMFWGNPHLLHWSLYASFVVIVYSLLTFRISSLAAKIATILIAIAPPLFHQSFFDYTYLAYLVYILLAFLYIERWIKTWNNSYLFISFLFVGFSTWSRITEPFWLVCLFMSVVGLVLYVKKKGFLNAKFLKTILTWGGSLIVLLTIQQSWRIFSGVMQKTDSSVLTQADIYLSDVKRFNLFDFAEVIVLTYKATISTWQPALFVLIILLFIERKRIGECKYLILILLISIFGLIAGSYDYSLYIKDWRDILPSQKGLSGFMPILMLYIIFILASEQITKFSKKIGIK